MRFVKINKKELLDIVRANKVTHVAEYNEAIEGYKNTVLKIAKDNLKLAKTGDVNAFAKMVQRPTPPTSYETEYNRAIRMLELSVDDVIELEEDTFGQLVLDEWVWKHSFLAATSMYKAG